MIEMKQLNQDEKNLISILSVKMGRIFEEAIKFGFSSEEFAELFLPSRVFLDYYDNFGIHSQSPRYIIGLFFEEMTQKVPFTFTELEFKNLSEITKKNLHVSNISIKKNDLLIQNDSGLYELFNSAHWFGYLLFQWSVFLNVNGKDIIKGFNLKMILDYYDLLHTEDILVTLDRIYEKDSIFRK